MITIHAERGKPLYIGLEGENNARKVIFDLSHWRSVYGPGTVQLLVQRTGETTPYPAALTVDGNRAIWAITAADTAIPGSMGKAELRYMVNDTLAKSEIWNTIVMDALGEPSETPPEAYQGYVDQVLKAGATAEEAAQRAVNAAIRQPYPNAETGTWWAWNAETGQYEDTGESYGGSGEGGTSDHAKLTNRDAPDQHPMSAITGLEKALEDKQPAGAYLTKETDPTVPEWAKQPQKPSYTASEVGADPSGTAESQVAAHNTGADTHSDIRLLIQGLTDRLNALADSDDTTLDQLSEIVAYIKSNRDLISAITTSKVSVADIVDNLTTNVADKPLSAAQGVALKALIDAITIPEKLPNPNALTFTGAVNGSYDGSAPLTVEIPSGGGGSGLPTPTAEDDGKVPTAKAGTYVLETPSGGGDTEKEWRLLAEIDFGLEENQILGFTWTELNGVTEIYVEANGIQNISTTTDSGLNLNINGIGIAQAFIQSKKSGTTAYQYCLAKYNGLAWRAERSGLTTNAGYIVMAAGAIPYTSKTGVGAADTLNLSAPVSAYICNAGNFKIWVR